MGLEDRTPPTPAEQDDCRERFSNRGRWGEDAGLGCWEFQLLVAPLVIKGATGSPVNPVAVF